MARGKRQQAVASLSLLVETEVLVWLWDIAPGEGMGPVRDPPSSGQQSRIHVLWAVTWLGRFL